LVRVPESTAGNSYLGTTSGLPGDPEVTRPAMLAYLARSKASSQIKSLTDVFGWMWLLTPVPGAKDSRAG
jgi:hypothetical protein